MNNIPEWEEWVRTLSRSTNPRDTDLLIVKIKVLLQEKTQRDIERLEGMKQKPNIVRASPTHSIGFDFSEPYNQALSDAIAALKETK